MRLSTRSPKDAALDLDKEEKKEQIIQKTIKHLLQLGVNKEHVDEWILAQQKESPKGVIYKSDLIGVLTPEQANEILVKQMEWQREFLKVRTSKDVVRLLSMSERASQDIYWMLIGKDALATTDKNQEKLCSISFREWVDMEDQWEFRCFFYGRALTAISQYDYYIFNRSLQDKETRATVQQMIQSKFDQLKDRLPMQNGVIDFVIIKSQVFMIELNPFNDYHGAGTSCPRVPSHIYSHTPPHTDAFKCIRIRARK